MARAFALAEVLSGALESDDTRESAASAPDAAAEARELDDLRVIDGQVRARALVLDVVREDVRVCGFEPGVCMPCMPKRFSAQSPVTYVTCAIGRWKGEDVHDLLGGEGGRHGGYHVGAPVLHVLGDPLALDHDHLWTDA